MKTSEIKKGMRIKLANGWFGTMKDNMRGVTRLAEVEGYYTETGSIYSFNIVSVCVDGVWDAVQYTEKELKVREMNLKLFGV